MVTLTLTRQFLIPNLFDLFSPCDMYYNKFKFHVPTSIINVPWKNRQTNKHTDSQEFIRHTPLINSFLFSGVLMAALGLLIIFLLPKSSTQSVEFIIPVVCVVILILVILIVIARQPQGQPPITFKVNYM